MLHVSKTIRVSRHYAIDERVERGVLFLLIAKFLIVFLLKAYIFKHIFLLN